MNWKYFAIAIALSPLILALAYVIVIMSYIIVPIFIATIIVAVSYAGLMAYREEQNRKP